MRLIPAHPARVVSNNAALSLLLVVGAAATSHAAPFSLLVLDNGGGAGMLGSPLRPSAGTFYSSGMISQGLPPTPESVAFKPILQFDSYVAMGGWPVSETAYANPPSGFIGDTFVGSARNPLELRGVRYVFPINVFDPVANPTMAGPAHSRPGPAGADSVFIGRLTVARGTRPVCPSIVVGASFNLPDTIVVSASLDGDSVEILPGNATRPTNALMVRSILAAQTTLPGFGDADSYDLYAVSLGAPAARPPVAAPPSPPPPSSSPANPPSNPPASLPPSLAPGTPPSGPVASLPADPPAAAPPSASAKKPAKKVAKKPAPKPKAKKPKSTKPLNPKLVRSSASSFDASSQAADPAPQPAPLVAVVMAQMGMRPGE